MNNTEAQPVTEQNLEQMAKAVSFKDFESADSHKELLLGKGELLGRPIHKVKIKRRGGDRGERQMFDVIAYAKIIRKDDKGGTK